MKTPSPEFTIGSHTVGGSHPTYFIADVAANHDGDLTRAKELINMCAEAGADAAKFQHFTAKTIVSDHGFRSLGDQLSHQATWDKSVFDVYDDASLNADWTPALQETCAKAGIDFFTSPYSTELVDFVDPFVSAFKIGSGDITWQAIANYMASKGKPVIVASGASSMDDVQTAVQGLLEINPDVCLMQCNTNYTASLENFKYINLNVLKTYAAAFPGLVLGLSDHTPGHATVLGAVALGARLIEKHFTDDNDRVGPDHKFSMNPESWKEMVDRTRELEASLGLGIKKIEDNELDTVVLQRRCVRTTSEVTAGTRLTRDMTEVLRPCPEDAVLPNQLDSIIDRVVRRDLPSGEAIRWTDLE